MINLLDILRTISRILYIQFGNEYYIYTEEVKKEIKRPSFFIDVMPVLTENYIDYKDKLINIDIMYFSKNETNEENLSMIDEMDGLFRNTLQVKDITIAIPEINFKTIDGILHCSFALDFSDYVDFIAVGSDSISKNELDESLGYTEDSITTMQGIEIE